MQLWMVQPIHHLLADKLSYKNLTLPKWHNISLLGPRRLQTNPPSLPASGSGDENTYCTLKPSAHVQFYTQYYKWLHW